MNKKEEAFKLFDEGKKPNCDEVKALGLILSTRYIYYSEWLKEDHGTSPEEVATSVANRYGKKPEENTIKIKGEINLGTIDFQKERDQAIAELRELQKNHTAESYELRERLHQQELEIIKLTFQCEIEKLAEMIKAIPPRSTFMEELATFREVAEEMGYHRDK